MGDDVRERIAPVKLCSGCARVVPERGLRYKGSNLLNASGLQQEELLPLTVPSSSCLSLLGIFVHLILVQLN